MFNVTFQRYPDTPIDIQIQPASGSYDNAGFVFSDEELQVTSTTSENKTKEDIDKVVLSNLCKRKP